MTQCPQCHQMNAEQARFCTGCGAELTRQCNACGKLAPPDARYCPQCGAAILTEPPVPWIERRFSPEVRLALHTVTRGIGITMLIMAFVTAILTPPPAILDDVTLLIGGATFMVISELLKYGRKPKPPGGHRPAIPEPPPPGGIELTPPQELLEAERTVSQPGQPPSSTQGPFLN